MGRKHADKHAIARFIEDALYLLNHYDRWEMVEVRTPDEVRELTEDARDSVDFYRDCWRIGGLNDDELFEAFMTEDLTELFRQEYVDQADELRAEVDDDWCDEDQVARAVEELDALAPWLDMPELRWRPSPEEEVLEGWRRLSPDAGDACPETFFCATVADFREVPAPPSGEPDFESPSGSCYWYGDGGVYRRSDHWGRFIASCGWTLDGMSHGGGRFDPDYAIRTGFCPWSSFLLKGPALVYDDGLKGAVELTFDDIRAGSVTFEGRPFAVRWNGVSYVVGPAL